MATAVALDPSSEKTRVEARHRESLEELDMDDEQHAEEWRAGEAMTQAQAVAYALENIEDRQDVGKKNVGTNRV